MAKKHNEDHFSPRVADLMSALTLIFLFISVVYMLQVNKEKEHIEIIAKDFKNTKHDIYSDLNKEFKEDLKKWNAYIDEDTLSITFKEPDVFFDIGSSNINKKFKDILDDFFPRYINILFTKYKNEIEEIRIEGHTSSEWNKNDDSLQAYFKNMTLSQEKSKSVLEYCMLLNTMKPYREFLISKATANGLSYSHRIIENGKENFSKSRRVEFKIKTTAEAHINDILKAGGFDEAN